MLEFDDAISTLEPIHLQNKEEWNVFIGIDISWRLHNNLVNLFYSILYSEIKAHQRRLWIEAEESTKHSNRFVRDPFTNGILSTNIQHQEVSFRKQNLTPRGRCWTSSIIRTSYSAIRAVNTQYSQSVINTTAYFTISSYFLYIFIQTTISF